MSKKITKIIITILTIVAVFTSIVMVTKRFYNRSIGEYYQFYGFYAQEPNTIDVLFVGSSRIHNNINPAALWESYGISSYALGSNSQSVDTSYYALKEALKTQHPKVAVVEVSQVSNLDGKTDGIPAVYGMKYGANYVESVVERREFENSMDSLLVYPLYHSRYDLVDKNTYIGDEFNCYPKTKAAGYKGEVEHLFYVAYPPYTDEYVKEGEVFSATADYYMDRIVDLCKKEGIELIFTLTPSVNRFEVVGVTDYINRHPDVNYLNFSDYYDEMEIDSGLDFIDEGHMNIYGGMKTGKFMGGYLKERYDLVDHRGDPKYLSWDENLAYHYQMIVDNELPTTNGFGTYFDNFPNENYVFIVSLLNGYDFEFIGQEDALKHVMCDSAVYKLGGTWIVDGPDILYAALGYTNDSLTPTTNGNLCVGVSKEDAGPMGRPVDVNWHGDIGNRSFEVVKNADEFKLLVDSVDYAVYKNYGSTLCKDGIEILVYDKLSEQVVDCVCFDAGNGWAATRNEPK